MSTTRRIGTWQSVQTRSKRAHKQIAYNVSHSHDDDDKIEAEDEDEDELEHAANPARGSERQFLPIPAVRPQLSGTGTQAGGPGVTTYTRPRLHGLFLQQSPASGVPVGSLGATRTYLVPRKVYGRVVRNTQARRWLRYCK